MDLKGINGKRIKCGDKNHHRHRISLHLADQIKSRYSRHLDIKKHDIRLTFCNSASAALPFSHCSRISTDPSASSRIASPSRASFSSSTTRAVREEVSLRDIGNPDSNRQPSSRLIGKSQIMVSAVHFSQAASDIATPTPFEKENCMSLSCSADNLAVVDHANLSASPALAA